MNEVRERLAAKLREAANNLERGLEYAAHRIAKDVELELRGRLLEELMGRLHEKKEGQHG